MIFKILQKKQKKLAQLVTLTTTISDISEFAPVLLYIQIFTVIYYMTLVYHSKNKYLKNDWRTTWWGRVYISYM